MNAIFIPSKSIIGGLVKTNDGVDGDTNTKLIEQLIKNQFKFLGYDDATGWDILYCNSLDGTLWEVQYLQSELQGGGPPSLFAISIDQAKQKYSKINGVLLTVHKTLPDKACDVNK
jgi:Immunity protein 27